MAVDVIVTRKPVKYVRRTRRSTLKVCKDLDHARNYSKSITAVDNHVVKLTVWVDDTHFTVWRRGKGWTEIREGVKRWKR